MRVNRDGQSAAVAALPCAWVGLWADEDGRGIGRKNNGLFILYFSHIALLYGCRREGRRRFGNKNKDFILYFSHLALPL